MEHHSRIRLYCWRVTCVLVPIWKGLHSMSKFETIWKGSFVTISTISSNVNSRAVRKASMPLTWKNLIIRKPVICSITIFDSIFKCSYVGITIRLKFISKSTEVSIVIYSFKDGSIIEDRYWKSIKSVLLIILFDSRIFGFGLSLVIILNKMHTFAVFNHFCLPSSLFFISQLLRFKSKGVHVRKRVILEYLLNWLLFLLAFFYI